MKTRTKTILAALVCVAACNVHAQQTGIDMPQLTVNHEVTTVITASEPIKLVDISTDKVAGDQPLPNVVRLKPKECVYANGEVLAIVTIVTERYRTQYSLVYTTHMEEAVTDKEVQLTEQTPFTNPRVQMPMADIVTYARRVWMSPPLVQNVKTRAHRLTMRLNNIYAVGEYFFLDFSVENKTHLPFEIDELRVKLCDKKQAKATNSQVIELQPVFLLEPLGTFRYGYRNVIVIPKLTFPNDKVLTIELNEQQISGRFISISIDYKHVLRADAFNDVLRH